MNIIGDIAGNYLTFLALIKQMPPSPIVSLGDVCDRGPRTKELIEWFIKTNSLWLFGNHEHLFLDYYFWKTVPGFPTKYLTNFYHKIEGTEEFKFFEHTFTLHGGKQTLKSYHPDYKNQDLTKIIPRSHIDKLLSLPKTLELPDQKVLLSHAPIFHNRQEYELPLDIFNPNESTKAIFNRNVGLDYAGLNIFGHNGNFNVVYYTDKFPPLERKEGGTPVPQPVSELRGLCLDTSFAGVLSGLHLPTMTVYQQEYID